MGSQFLGPWVYTMTFNNPVNNVRLRILDYTFKINLSTGTVTAAESIKITTNSTTSVITPCDACCYELVGDTIFAKSLPGCIGSSQVALHSGSGIFTISSSVPFTSITLQSIVTTPSLGGIRFDLCSFEVNA